jgi:outer membrane protein assembly factor BamB
MMRKTVLTVGAAFCLVAAAGTRADWPHFRGPNFDGISEETGLRANWSTPIPVLWEREVGSSYSSFACVGDRVYTCGQQQGKQVVHALDADTGRVVWENAFEKEYRESNGDGPRATPTVHDGRVYILGAFGRLLCLKAEDGTEIWSRQFSHMPQWAYSGSVLIEGDLAIAGGGSSDGALVAYDRRTGEPKWSCGEDPVGYATPYPFTFEGKRYIVGFTGVSAIIAEADTGRLVWREKWDTAWNVNAATPIFHDGYLFLTSGYQTGSGLFKLSKDGDRLAARKVWTNQGIMNKFQSPILHKGKLYTSDQNALVCADFMTGDQVWRIPRIKHGTLAMSEGTLFLLTQSGELQIAPADPKGFEPLTKQDVLSGRCWTVSVIHRGRLYSRNLTKVTCLNLRK